MDTKPIIGQRDAFFNRLYKTFETDKNCVIITADNGAPTLDQFHALKGQFYQVGIAEQQMVGMAAGMACEGRKVWIYAIAPFVTTRVHEFVKLDLCAMHLPVTILGVGAGYAYDIMGPSHHTVEDISIMRPLPGLRIWSPADAACAAYMAEKSYASRDPVYIRFDRTGLPDIYEERTDFSLGMNVHDAGVGGKITLVTTGVTVGLGQKVLSELWAKAAVQATLVDVHELKPINKAFLREVIRGKQLVVTYEEHLLAGGLGSIVAELMVDGDVPRLPLLRIGVPDTFTFDLGGREAIWQKHGLTPEAVAARILQWPSWTAIRMNPSKSIA